jgi:hypothetical protein
MASTGTSPRVVAIPVPAAKHAIYAGTCIVDAAEAQLPNLMGAVCIAACRFAEDDRGRCRPPTIMLKTEFPLAKRVGGAKYRLASETTAAAQTAKRLRRVVPPTGGGDDMVRFRHWKDRQGMAV